MIDDRYGFSTMAKSEIKKIRSVMSINVLLTLTLTFYIDWGMRYLMESVMTLMYVNRWSSISRVVSELIAHTVSHWLYWLVVGHGLQTVLGPFRTWRWQHRLFMSSAQPLKWLPMLLVVHTWRQDKTRMHSSRMCTVRCSGHLRGGGCLSRGCLPNGGRSLPGGWVNAREECLPRDVHLSPMDRQTPVKT